MRRVPFIYRSSYRFCTKDRYPWVLDKMTIIRPWLQDVGRSLQVISCHFSSIIFVEHWAITILQKANLRLKAKKCLFEARITILGICRDKARDNDWSHEDWQGMTISSACTCTASEAISWTGYVLKFTEICTGFCKEWFKSTPLWNPMLFHWTTESQLAFDWLSARLQW